MKYSIFFPTPLDQLDKVNDNVDVCIQLENGKQYTFVVATPSNLQNLMKKDRVSFICPCSPFLIVEELTENNVYSVLEEVMKDPVLSHVYGDDLWIQD